MRRQLPVKPGVARQHAWRIELKKIIHCFLILTIIMIAPFVKAGDSELKSYLEEWLVDPESKTEKVPSKNLAELISQNDVEEDLMESDYFAEYMFNHTIDAAKYALTKDLDGDGIQEIITLSMNPGSLRAPLFFILKKETAEAKYKIALNLECDLMPVIFNNTLYFIETIEDFYSKINKGDVRAERELK